MKRNEIVLNDLPGQLYTIESNDKTPDNCKCILGVGEEGMGGGGCVVFAGGREMKIFSTVFQDFWKNFGGETVFLTLDGAGNCWKK